MRPRDLAGKTRRRLAVEQLTELVAVDKKIKATDQGTQRRSPSPPGSTLMDLPGVGPVVAARVLADVADVARFADRNRFASWTGTAPIEASSGEIAPPPALPGRQPADEPHDPHRRGHPYSPRHPRTDLLPAQAHRGQDPDGGHALPEEDASATPSTASCSPTPSSPRLRAPRRAREGTAGRLQNPARPAHTRTPALRISHFPDPHPRPYRPPRPARTPARDRLPSQRADAPEPSKWSAPPDQRP